MKTEEGKLKDQVKAFLKERGVWFNMPVPTGYGEPLLDFIGCYKGRFFAIETKAPGKKPTPRQALMIEKLRNAKAFVVWDDNAYALETKLTAFFEAVDDSVAF